MTAGVLAPFRYGAFRALVIGRTISMLGSAIAPIALAFAVLDLTGSPAQLGLVIGARSAASVIFMLIGGVIADRLPRNVVMMGSDTIAGLTQAAIAALVLTGNASLSSLIVLSVVNGVASAGAMPAQSALLSQTVPRDLLKPANAVKRLTANAAKIVGAAVGGILVVTVGAGWGLAVDALTFLLAVVCYAFARVPDRKPRKPSRVLADLREGWSEVIGRSWLWSQILGAMVFNAAFLGAMTVLGPFIADETIGRREWGFVVAAQTAGMVAGAFIAVRVRARRLLLVGVCTAGLAVLGPLGLALYPHVLLLVVLAFVGGVGLEQFGIAWETALQENVAEERLARVYSYDMLGSFLAMPIGQVAVGPAAAALGGANAMLIAAGVMTAALAGILLSRQVRTLEHPPKTTPGPAPAPAVEPASVPGAA
jgi:MFS family permease